MNTLFNEVIAETDDFTVAQDWEVPIPAFYIVSPKRTVDSLIQFTDKEVIEFALLVKKIRQGMSDVLGINTVYLFQNEDSIHGFHLWMLPRYPWMDSFGGKIQSVRPIMDYAQRVMKTEGVSDEIKISAEKMRRYLKIVPVVNGSPVESKAPEKTGAKKATS